MISSSQYYDKLAPDYKKLMEQRSEFLLAIERKVIELCQGLPVANFLDVGCGNGARSKRLMEALKPAFTLLNDESAEMIRPALGLQSEHVHVIQGDFLSLQPNVSFHAITCLWNVFGHVESKAMRLAFLKKIYALLDQSGIVFIDLNNRYNVNQYGWWNVIKNMWKDAFHIRDAGKFDLKRDGEVSFVYVHNPFEFDGLVAESGFTSIRKMYIDYRTGQQVKSFLRGQTFYCIKK